MTQAHCACSVYLDQPLHRCRETWRARGTNVNKKFMCLAVPCVTNCIKPFGLIVSLLVESVEAWQTDLAAAMVAAVQDLLGCLIGRTFTFLSESRYLTWKINSHSYLCFSLYRRAISHMIDFSKSIYNNIWVFVMTFGLMCTLCTTMFKTKPLLIFLLLLS